MTFRAILLIGCLVVGIGCSSTQEVETSRPRAYEGVESDGAENAGQARLSVFLERGATDLPEDVDQLRFRIAEIRLRESDGDWLRLPSDGSLIEFDRGARSARRVVLDTRVPPGDYDSLAIALDRVFVRFNENAGAPLTTARNSPQQLALDLEPTLDGPTTLYLRLEAGPSLTRTEDCRWFFVPIFETDVANTQPGR